MMKSVLSLAIFVLMLATFTPQVQGEVSQNPTVRIVFDNYNASLRIYINESEYFNLTFRKVYVTKNPYAGEMSGVGNVMVGEGFIGSMNITEESGWNEKMGNYTKVTMWKNVKIKNKVDFPFVGPKEINANVTINFYMSEKNYTKGGIRVGRNTIRYDTIIRTGTKGDFVIIEESMSGKDLISGAPGEVYEFNPQNITLQQYWDRMNMTDDVVKHKFGSGNMGMLKFKIRRSNITYSWEYDNKTTFYSYNGESFHLFYAFQNENGTVIQDPYITLPTPIMGNPNTIVEGVEDVVNYIMDHAISLGLGIIVATVIILTGPAIRRLR